MSALTRRQFVLAAVAGATGVVSAGVTWSRSRRPSNRTPTFEIAGKGSSPTTRPPRSTAAAPTTTVVAPTSTTATPSKTTPAATTPTTSAPTASGAGIVMLCREAWKAAAPTRQLPPHTITHLTVHHTGVALSDNREAPVRVKGHQAYHQRNGFTDIAYHLVIDAGGNVYEGRAFDQPGETFTEYDPRGHLLVTLEGNFNEQGLPDAQLRSLVDALAWGLREFGLTADRIAAHRDLASTSCPGDAVYGLMADGTMAALVEARRGAAPALVRSCGPDADARVAAIAAEG